jgi:hypothetical protein
MRRHAASLWALDEQTDARTEVRQTGRMQFAANLTLRGASIAILGHDVHTHCRLQGYKASNFKVFREQLVAAHGRNQGMIRLAFRTRRPITPHANGPP